MSLTPAVDDALLFALASREPFTASIATTQPGDAKEHAMDTWYDAQDVARRLKVTPRTVQRWCRERRIPHVRIGRGIRFTAQQLVEIESAYRVEPRQLVDVSASNPSYAPRAVVVPMKRGKSA